MKKKTKLIIAIIFWSILAVGDLYWTIADFISGKDSTTELIKNIVILLVIAVYGIYRNIHKLKFLGKYDPDADDERDKMIEQKTNHQVLNILEYVLIFGGLISVILASYVKNDYQMIALIFVGITMEVIWILDLILTTVISIINYHKS